MINRLIVVSTFLSITFGLIFLITPLQSLANQNKNIEILKASDQVHILTGVEYGTNIGVIETSKGLILIDPMPGDDLLIELERTIRSITKQPITFLLNTHGHFDHTGGNEFFTKKGATIVANPNNLKDLKTVTVVSHMAEDLIFYHKASNTIFTGDVFDNSWHPTFYAGGKEGFILAINKILSLGNEKSMIVPGHGKPTIKSTVRTFRDNTLEWIAKIHELHAKGLDLDAMFVHNETRELVERFNTEQRKPFLPARAYKRFIERTISIVKTDKVKN